MANAFSKAVRAATAPHRVATQTQGSQPTEYDE